MESWRTFVHGFGNRQSSAAVEEVDRYHHSRSSDDHQRIHSATDRYMTLFDSFVKEYWNSWIDIKHNSASAPRKVPSINSPLRAGRRLLLADQNLRREVPYTPVCRPRVHNILRKFTKSDLKPPHKSHHSSSSVVADTP